jgi:hypothetical protein
MAHNTHHQPHEHRQRRAVRPAARGGLVLAGIELLVLLLAVVASAGTYQVSACNYAEGANNSWVWSTTELAAYENHAVCPYLDGGTGGRADQEGGLSSTDRLGSSVDAQPGSSAGWTFKAPAGETIKGIVYERYLGHEDDTSNTWSPALLADGAIVETCTVTLPHVGCFIGGPPGHGGLPATITGLSAKELTFGETCQAPTGLECVTGGTEHNVWAAMYGASVTLEDPTPPTLGQPAGALWEPGQANGYHKGTESVTVSAQDTGSGVQSIVLSADGQPVETYNAPCNFTFPEPCPLATGPRTLTLPTTQLTDGPHELTLTAIDAAGNKSTLATEQINIENNPPPPPTQLTATPTQPGAATFTATWADPPAQAAPITSATYQICPTSTTTGCTTPTAAPAAGPLTITLPGPGTWTLAVWLTNAAGNTNPANAAHTTLTVPASNNESGDSTGGSPGGTNGAAGSNPGGSGGGGYAPAKKTLDVTETLHGRQLVVHVSSSATGRVRVSYTASYHGKTIAHGTKTLTLRHGRSTTIFNLSARAAAHATIRVGAKLDHQPAVTRTLSRHAPRHSEQRR